jgi:hypothetical protein
MERIPGGGRPLKRKPSKYYNKKETIDGITFDSKKEAAYYQELKLRHQAKDIMDYKLQPEFELQPALKARDGKKHRAIKYRADFLIVHNDGTLEAIDVKGYKTPEFKLKEKMFAAKHPDIKLTIV